MSFQVYNTRVSQEIPAWHNTRFPWLHLKSCWLMVLWLEDTSMKKQALFRESLIMVSRGDDGRWRRNDENEAGVRPVLWNPL